jgi:hypothetical protein
MEQVMTRSTGRDARALGATRCTLLLAAGAAAQPLAPDITVTKVVNAPPTIPAIRVLRTLVYLDFKPLPGNRSELTLRNFGYGDGEEWAKSRAYFARAWSAVMASLEQRFAPK